ncbi:MAG: hypothetical protein E7504_07725 [Ruminococcus sp.]|nr:hypothetical protein [Ruminococcus sp.]
MRIFSKLKFDMILLMQLKFVSVAMIILITVFLIMLGSINMMMRTVSQSQSHRLLVQIAESDRYNAPEPMDDFPPENEPPPFPGNAGSASDGEMQLLAENNWWENNWWENGSWWEGSWQPPTQPDAEQQADPRPPKPEWGDWPPQQETRPEPPHLQETRPEEPVPPEHRPTEPKPTESIPPVTDTPHTDPVVITTPAPERPPVHTQRVEKTEPPATTTTEESTTVSSAVSETTTETTTTTMIPEPPPKPDKWNLTITIDHFALLAGSDGEFLGLRNTEDYTDEQAMEIMNGILKTGEKQGMYGWLQYYVTAKDYGTLIVVTDKTSDQGLLNNLFRITIIVGCLMLLLLLAVLCVLSKWITTPVQTAFTRQKQFVSDAGHELKTPLTILSANADILQDEIGENKWLGYMQEQTGRMNQLVGDLLRLARMDNAVQEYELAPFNLSMAVNATALPFESQAFELSKNLELDIQPGVEYCGSEQHIRQLIAIFIDNAMKYSDENGIIKVTLLKRGDKCILEFYNTGCEISPADTEKIFERFYRGDKARNNKGKSGYGLGLAIAKSIMDIHKIKIQVTCEQGGWIRFLLTM